MPKKVSTETREALPKGIGDRYRAGTKDTIPPVLRLNSVRL